MIFLWTAGVGLALIWLSRVIDAARGLPSLADISRPEWDRTPFPAGNRVTIVVPARNEQGSIRSTLERLLLLDYDGYEVIAVDDRSTDSTGKIMDEVGLTGNPKLKIVHIERLPPGWMGKTYAM